MSDTSSVAARVQGWDMADQALVLAGMAQSRGEGGAFAPAELANLFVDLALPSPSRVSNTLASLEKKTLVTRGHRSGTWRLTPIGRERARRLLSDMDVAALAAESASVGLPLLGHAPHALISPALAPPELIAPLQKFLAAHPFERNVFGMTRFPEEGDDDADPDPVGPALDAAREACKERGLEFHLASDRAMHPDLWTNIAAHMWASKYGIAFFEDRRGRGVNINLCIEVGSMLMAGRSCALLKDRTIERMPTDLVGKIYKPVDLDKVRTITQATDEWVRRDLEFG